MRKLCVNRSYGGFSLSPKAKIAIYNEGSCKHQSLAPDAGLIDNHREYDARGCPALIKVVELLGVQADGRFASLHIVEIPDDIEIEWSEYDGAETVHEAHRSW